MTETKKTTKLVKASKNEDLFYGVMVGDQIYRVYTKNPNTISRVKVDQCDSVTEVLRSDNTEEFNRIETIAGRDSDSNQELLEVWSAAAFIDKASWLRS